MPTKTRRVVTVNDANGKAVIASETLVESQPGKRGDVHVTSLWMTEAAPPALNGAEPKNIPPLPVHDGVTFRFMEIGPGTEPHMHRTETLDYIIVFEGELDMFLDDGAKVHLNEGDIMIQRGTRHGWANPGTKTCRFATVIIDAGGGWFEG
jgi:quercetin dioxygenase-like cupin family protein